MPIRLFVGMAAQDAIREGTEIVFSADEPPAVLQDGWAIEVVMPDDRTHTLFAEPAHGPTYVEWKDAAGLRWVFPLEQVERGLWRVQFSKRRRILSFSGDARSTS